jgi:hypothetical protein
MELLFSPLLLLHTLSMSLFSSSFHKGVINDFNSFQVVVALFGKHFGIEFPIDLRKQK